MTNHYFLFVGALAVATIILQELGTAFIIGLLLDAFLVRPLMVPAFILVFRRMNSGKSAIAPILPGPPR